MTAAEQRLLRRDSSTDDRTPVPPKDPSAVVLDPPDPNHPTKSPGVYESGTRDTAGKPGRVSFPVINSPGALAGSGVSVVPGRMDRLVGELRDGHTGGPDLQALQDAMGGVGLGRRVLVWSPGYEGMIRGTRV